jgi:hypothetical protein
MRHKRLAAALSALAVALAPFALVSAETLDEARLPWNPFANASAGDWEALTLNTPGSPREDANFLIVESATPGAIVLKAGAEDEGWTRTTHSRADAPTIAEYFPAGFIGSSVKFADETRTVRGRAFRCTKISFEFARGGHLPGSDETGTVTFWISQEVKGAGLVALETSLKSGWRATLEVNAFGSGDRVEWGARPHEPTTDSEIVAHENALEKLDDEGVRLFHHERPAASIVRVPYEALEAILKKYPNGALVREAEFRDLLRKAGLAQLSDLDRRPEEKPPVAYAIESGNVTGRLEGELATFQATAQVRVLGKETTLVPVIIGSASVSATSVDGKPARLAPIAPGYGVLVEPGEHSVAWTFTVAAQKGDEKGSGSLLVPLVPSCVATKLAVDLSGELEVVSPSTPLVVASADRRTHVEGAAGGRDSVLVQFHPKNPEAPATPYVTVEDASRFLVRRGLCQLDLVAVFQTWRAGRDRFAMVLPKGFVVRSLESSPAGATWVQRDDKVELSFARARTGETGVLLRAELVTPQEGALALQACQYPETARHSGLVGVARGDDVTVAVTGTQALERADLDELPATTAEGLLRVYRHGSAPASIALSLRPLEPRVSLELTAVEDIREKELKLLAVYAYRVQEGSVFQVRAELPESFRIDQVEVRDGRGMPLKNEIKTETVPGAPGKEGRVAQVIDLEGGIRAGHEVLVTVRAAREVPAGISTEGPLAVPALAGSPATTTGGYLAFTVDPAFRLRGDVSGLLPFPVEALASVGLSAPGAALGFRVEGADYKGSLALQKKETRVAAKTLVFQQIDERTVATDAVFDFDVTGAPVEKLELLIPKEASALVRIDGDDVSEHAPAGDAPDGRERRIVRFQSPKAGAIRLLVHFDTQVPGFETSEGEAKTKLELPRVSTGEGCERERGTIALFSSDATELVPVAQNLHTLEVTEVGDHPRVKPQGRPLFAYSYAGNAWKLGLEVERHAPAYVLSAIVERLGIASSVGRDGVGRHTASFVLKNLSHQYFTLQMPENSQIWSILVNGEGVKPAEDGGQKIVPIPPGTAPDKPIEVAVSYEVRSNEMGRFGSGQLVAPVLLLSKGGEPVPVLKTGWSLSLPDEFKYVEFSGNVDGAHATENLPLVVQAWDWDRARFVQIALFLMLGLLVASSERARTSFKFWGVSIFTTFINVLSALVRGVRRLLSWKIVLAGVVLVGLSVVCLATLSAQRSRRAGGGMNYPGFDGASERTVAAAKPADAPVPFGAAAGVPAQSAPVPPAEPQPEAESDDAAKTVEKPMEKDKVVLRREIAEGQLARLREEKKALKEDVEELEKRSKELALESDLDAKLAMRKQPLGPGNAPDSRASGSTTGHAKSGDANEKMDKLTEAGAVTDGVFNGARAHRVPVHGKASAFGEKGLRSLVLALPTVGTTLGFAREGGEARLVFRYVRTDVWSWALVLVVAAGFALGLWIPKKTSLSTVGFLLIATVVLSAIPYLVAPALTGGPSNALLAGILLAAPVRALLALEKARREAAARRVRVTSVKGAGPITTAVLVLASALLFAPSEVRAQEKPETSPDRRVFVPYDPEHPDKPTDKVFVPADLYDELWHRAHPEAAPTKRPTPPAAYAVSDVTYEGELSASGLKLAAHVKVEILKDGWVEAPLGLDGTAVTEARITPATARIEPSAQGYALVAQGPATYELDLSVLAPHQGAVFSFGTLRSGASVLKLTTHEKDHAIKVVRDGLGGQSETMLADGGSHVEASLGSESRVRVVYGPREIVAVGGASEASARSTTLYLIRRGRIEVVSRFEFEVSGDGRESFHFSVPKDLEITGVAVPALRSWRVLAKNEGRANGFDQELEVQLKRPCGAHETVEIKAERLTSATTPELPELTARAVSRDEGVFGVSVESGLRVSFGKSSAALRQVDPSELSSLAAFAGGSGPERAYAFTKRPAAIPLELVEDALELKATSRVLGVVRGDRYEVSADVEFQAKHGRTYELTVLVPSELELDGEPAGVREHSDEIVGATRRLTFGLAKALIAPATTTLKLKLARRLARGETSVALPDVRASGVAGDDGEVVLCAGEGIRLRADAEPERFQPADPDPIARRLGAPQDAQPSFAWTRRAKAPAGLSTQRASIEHPPAHVEGTVVTFVTVERDVVRTVARVFYEVTEAGVKVFSLTRPARLGERIAVHAPNQRELRSVLLPNAGDESLARRRFEIELESAVQGFYELTLEWEELVPPNGQIDVARLDLEGVSRSRGFVLVVADPSLTEKLELAKARTSGVQQTSAEKAYALPPGKDPRDFSDLCFRADDEGWRLGLDLKEIVVQEPAPARIETAKIDTVVHEDGSLLNRAVYRVRNRTLQFLAIRLPKGAEVWTVHVAGEPRRIHQLQDLTLVPLPKRADADMSFEVEVVFRTRLASGLGLFTRVAPVAPVFETKGVEVERTFWTLYLPETYEELWRDTSLDETHAVVSQAEDIKAEVQELAQLNDIASQSASSNRGQIAYKNLEENYRRVVGTYNSTRKQIDEVSKSMGQPSGKAAALLHKNDVELKKLEGVLNDIAKQQDNRRQQKAQIVAQQTFQNPMQQQLGQGQTIGPNVVIGGQVDSNGNPAQVGQGGAGTQQFSDLALAPWRTTEGAFKANRGPTWEGLDGAGKNPNAPHSVMLNVPQSGAHADLDQAQMNFFSSDADATTTPKKDEKNADGDRQIFYLEAKGAVGGKEPRIFFPNAEETEHDESADEAVDALKTPPMDKSDYGRGPLKKRPDSKTKHGDDKRYFGLKNEPEPERPAEMPPAPPPPQTPAPTPRDTTIGVGGGGGRGGRGYVAGVEVNQTGETPVSNPVLSLLNKGVEQAEAKRALLSIGFEFELPQGVEGIHLTTESATADALQVSLRVMPRSAIELGGRALRVLVLGLLLLAVARLGLHRSVAGKKAARALALVVAGALAGLALLSNAGAIAAALASVAALVRVRRASSLA